MQPIDPQTRIVFWTKDLKEIWKPRIDRMSKVVALTELETFLQGLRSVYVYHIHSDKFEESYAFLRKFDLVFYPITKSAVYYGFSHRHLPVKPGKPYHLYGVCVKRGREKLAEKFLEASREGDHATVGKLLGYPKCCIDFFCNTWPKSLDPIYQIAQNTENHRENKESIEVIVHPFCNQMLRYLGIRITPHLPCSFECKETIKLGEQWFKIMKKIDKEASEWILDLLSSPITWDCYRAVAIVDTPYFRLITNSVPTEERLRVLNLGFSSI